MMKPWLAVLLAGSVAGVGVVGANAVDSKAETLVVTSVRTLMSAPASPAVGSGFVSGGDLFDQQGTAKLGDGSSHCGVVSVTVAVPPSVTANCTSVFRLPDGELHLSGSRTYESIATGFTNGSIAVVGGTGKYASARGDGQVTRTSVPGGVGYQFDFSLLLD